MTPPTTRTELLNLLRSLPGIHFVTPSPQHYMQDEFDNRARQQITAQGLPSTYPYIGWHWQAESFDRNGALNGGQRIYFGGDHEVVASGLNTLTAHGLAVLGGRSDRESFVVRQDARPQAANPKFHDAWRTRLAVLTDPLLVPLRAGRKANCMNLLRARLPQNFSHLHYVPCGYADS